MITSGSLSRIEDVAGWLATTRALTVPVLTGAVDRLGPVMRRICGYQLGWLDEHGVPTTGSAGKAVRPALLLASVEAIGAPLAEAVPAAAAVELVHNCTLLQDDVMDEDLTRRQRPTAWALFGKSEAILAGDALLTLAFEVLAASGRAQAGRAVRELARTMNELIEGQSMDLGLEAATAVTLEQSLRMSGAKTASLLSCACRIGAHWSGAAEPVCQALDRLGRHLGMAYQFRDDLLGIWGDPRRTGKAAFADLGRRKKSLPVVAALTAAHPAAERLRRLYDRPGPLSAAQARQAAALVEEAGGRAWAERAARRALAKAEADLAVLKRSGLATSRLSALGRFLVGRDR